MILSKIRIFIDNKSKKICNIQPINKGVEIQIGKTITVFPKGTFVLPGFVDSHIHFFGVGETSQMPNFSDCHNEDDMIDIIKLSAFRRGEWIVGFGWNQEKFHKKDYPSKQPFDKAFPDTPIYLKRIDGHSALINTVAAKKIGISNKSINPSGGIIVKDEYGVFSGILIDNAMELVQSKLPFYSNSQIKTIIESSQTTLSQLGITEIYDMDFYPELFEYFSNNRNKFAIRINSFVKSQNDEWKGICELPKKNGLWNLIGYKHYLDGALGSRGASLLEKYSDANTYGIDLLTPNEVETKTKFALNNKLSIAIHAIGDKANRVALQTFNKFSRFKNKMRIEHCQMINSIDLEFLKRQNIICSVQPIHYVSDTKSGMVQSRIGPKRMIDSYRWKSIINAGGILVAGSDAPIENPNPFWGIDAFVNSDNKNELITMDEAIKAYIATPHKIYKKNRGKIEVGYDADFILINNNFIENQKSISKTNVLATIVNGNFVFNNGYKQ